MRITASVPLKEKAELILNGGEKTVAAILPILDDFERAIADKSEDPKAIKEGVQMIFNKFVKTLEGLGVKKIETNDKDFDVDFHEAIAMVPGMGDDKKGKIIDCVQTGYNDERQGDSPCQGSCRSVRKKYQELFFQNPEHSIRILQENSIFEISKWLRETIMRCWA